MRDLLSDDILNNLSSYPYEFVGLTQDGTRAIMRKTGNYQVPDVYHLDEAGCAKACEHARNEAQRHRLIAEMKRPTSDQWLAQRQASSYRSSAIRALQQSEELGKALSAVQEYKREHGAAPVATQAVSHNGAHSVPARPGGRAPAF